MPEYDLRVRHRLYTLQLGAYLLIAVVAVIGFVKLGNTQDELKHSQECTETFLGDSVTQTNNRADLQAAASKANLEMNLAWRKYVKWAIDTPPKDQKYLAAKYYVVKYFKKLDVYIGASSRLQRAAAAPFPTREAYHKCLDQ